MSGWEQGSLAAAGFLTGILFFSAFYFYQRRKQVRRIRALAGYLEEAHLGIAPVLSACGEGEFAKLEDEIYKTVTFLYQTREEALRAKQEFAGHLSDIAHQIKTPITAMSLALQLTEQGEDGYHLEQIRKQLQRLTYLEEALLLLARMDAGTFPLQKRETDVFTLLVLAADHLQELSAENGTMTEIPELGSMSVSVDCDWTMEALMNLMKNCMEHGAGKTIHCSYEQNPLYTQIMIRDEGEGFAKEDLPHLFKRFYRGRGAKEGGIGIGLALAKELIERQNGTILAKNMPEGGACFEIRFYRH